MSDAKTVLTKFENMREDRAGHEQTWHRVASLLLPLRKNFSGQSGSKGERRHTKIYDSSGLVAVSNFKAGLYGTVTNPATQWFEIGILGADENEYTFGAGRNWLDEVTRRLRISFSPAMSAFYGQAPAIYADIGVLGNGIMFSRELVGQQKFQDKTISLEDAYFSENDAGEVDELCRLMCPTAKQAIGEFGRDAVSSKVTAAFDKNSMEKFDFVHWVGTNPDYVPGATIGAKSFAFLSLYVEKREKRVVKQEFFHSFPFQVPRWDVASGETYGRGIGEMAIADVASGQAMRRTNLTAGERAANPTLLATDEQSMRQAVRAVPGSTIYGGMGLDGKRRVEVLYEGKNLSISLEMENQIRDSVKDAFLFSLMQIQGSADMTATEFLGRQQERWRLLGPHLGRIESEFLTPLIRRRFMLLMNADQIPQPPEEIAGRPLQVRYIGQAAKLQRVAEAESAMMTANGLMSVAQAKPEVMDRLDPDRFAEALDRGYGSNIIFSREEAAVIAEARSQQQQRQAMLEAAPDLARAGKDAAQAQQIANEAPAPA